MKATAARRPQVLILVQNLPVPFDRRVWQESLALTAAGYDVHVVCPRTKEHPLRRETLNGIEIYRYSPGPEARRSAGYLVEYPVAILSQLRLALTIRFRAASRSCISATRPTFSSSLRCRWSWRGHA